MLKIERIVIPLVVLQVVSVFMLWSLDSVNRVSQEIFTLFLAADLVAFALVGHVYRSSKGGSTVGRHWIIVAGFVILLLLLSTLFVS